MAFIDAGCYCPACGRDTTSYVPLPFHLQPLTQLRGDRYVVGRLLGSGGFGITYLGRDLTLGVRVAIKEFFPVGQASRIASVSNEVACYSGTPKEDFERGRERFLEEARRLAQLEKLPVVVGTRDFFEESNTAYLVMEYVQGTTLEELADQRGGRIAPDELFSLVRPLFPALRELHESGLIHRDISPENIMLEGERIRLIDFGCARESAGDDDTMTSMLKVGYSPVEQYSSGGQGTWTDVYALCATLYRCLTGNTPPASVDRTIGDDLRPPHELGVVLTGRQERALMRGLSVRPRRRIKTMARLEEELYADVAVAPNAPWWQKRVTRRAFIGAGVTASVAALAAIISRGREFQHESPTVAVPSDGSEVVNHNGEPLDYGTTGDVQWALYDDGALVISGEGRMDNCIWDYTAQAVQQPWSGYQDIITSITVEDGVRNIGENAFRSCGGAKVITIGKDVLAIGWCGLQGCGGLEAIVVSEESRRFRAVDGVLFNKEMTVLVQYPASKPGKEYTVPDGVEEAQEFAFAEFEKIHFPGSVTKLGSSAFEGCDNIESIELPKNLETIPSTLFWGNDKLASATIPASVKTIEATVFFMCDALKDIYYLGTKEQWKQIEIDEDNQGLFAATIHYASS